MTDDRDRKKYFVDTRMRANDPHKWHCYEALHDVWVAAFRDRAEADRYCEERNREEEANAPRMETMSVTVGGQTHTKTWIPGEADEQELADWANGLLSGAGMTVSVTQHKAIVEEAISQARRCSNPRVATICALEWLGYEEGTEAFSDAYHVAYPAAEQVMTERDRKHAEWLATQHKDAIPPPAPGKVRIDGVEYEASVRWDPSKFCEPTTRTWNLSPIPMTGYVSPLPTSNPPPPNGQRWTVMPPHKCPSCGAKADRTDEDPCGWVEMYACGSAEIWNEQSQSRGGVVCLAKHEKPKHPNEGERCCKAHAAIVWSFNEEVWSKLPERCGR